MQSLEQTRHLQQQPGPRYWIQPHAVRVVADLAQLQHRHVDGDDRVRSQFLVTGSARLMRQMGRTVVAQLLYDRGVQVPEGTHEPVLLRHRERQPERVYSAA